MKKHIETEVSEAKSTTMLIIRCRENLPKVDIIERRN